MGTFRFFHSEMSTGQVGSDWVNIFVNFGGSGTVENSRNLFFVCWKIFSAYSDSYLSVLTHPRNVRFTMFNFFHITFLK